MIEEIIIDGIIEEEPILEGEIVEGMLIPGPPGFSPTATVEKVGKVTTITIKDDIGTTTAEVLDGKDGEQGPQGEPGPQGEEGPEGPAGPGIPTGGTAGQFLVKASSANYDTAWVTVPNANGEVF